VAAQLNQDEKEDSDEYEDDEQANEEGEDKEDDEEAEAEEEEHIGEEKEKEKEEEAEVRAPAPKLPTRSADVSLDDPSANRPSSAGRIKFGSSSNQGHLYGAFGRVSSRASSSSAHSGNCGTARF
jgi:hypothetical protein